MKLKDHPAMIDKWPPGSVSACYEIGHRDPPLSKTEQLIVIGAKIIKDDFYLDFQSDQNTYSTIVSFDNLKFKQNLTKFLNNNKGRSLKEVFDIEVDF